MRPLFGFLPDSDARPPIWREAEQLWVLTRYSDVQTVLRTAKEVVEFQPRIRAIGQRAGRDYEDLVRLLSGILFFRNPPWHARARASLRRGLGVIGARMTEAEITPIIDGAVADLRGEGEVDVVRRLADRIPVLVMAHLLGLAEVTVSTMHLQGKGILNAWQRAMPLRIYDGLQRQAAEIDAALRSEIHRARAEGGPLQAFLDGVDGFDDDEAVALVFGIVMAGIETTSGLLASVLYAVATEPAHADALRSGAADERGFVDEVLRMAPPIRRLSARCLATRQRFGDVVLEPGSLIGIDVGAAQRDATMVEDPHRFDPHRAGPPLLSFGSGIHACLGGHIATLEARLLLRAALRADLRPPHPDGVEWDPDLTFCRLRRLELRFDPITTG